MSTSVTPRRRRWFRFSLRSLLLFSLCAGALPLLWVKLPAWRLDTIVECTESKAVGRTYRVGNQTLREVAPQHITFYKRDRAVFAIDFFLMYAAKADPSNDDNFSVGARTRMTRVVSPDLTKLLLADECHAVVYDLENCRVLREWNLLPELPGSLPGFLSVPAAAFSADGSRVAIACDQRGEIVLLNLASEEVVARVRSLERPRRMAFSADGSQILLEQIREFEMLNFDGSSALKHNVGDTSWRGGICFYQPTKEMPDGAIACYVSAESLLKVLSLKDKSVLKTVPINNGDESFSGFSPDGHSYVMSLPHQDRRSEDRTIFLRDVLSGDLRLICKYRPDFDKQGTDEDSTSMTSAVDDLCVISNPAGDAQLWKVGAQVCVGEVRPREITTLPSFHPGYDGPQTLTCWWQRYAHHQIASAGSARGAAVYLSGVHSPRRIEAGEIERDYIIRRNHPDEWYGVAVMGEFWLAVVCVGLLGWSLVRDWREL